MTNKLHPHIPQDANRIHDLYVQASSFNVRFAVALTKATSTMWTAYVFCVLACLGLCGLFGWLNPFVYLLIGWASQQFLQLVFLPVLSVGQEVMTKKHEIHVDEQYNMMVKITHDHEQFFAILSRIEKRLSDEA